jgi:hypothetical protein
VAAAFRAFAVAGDGQSSSTSSLTITVPTTGAGGTVAAGDYATIVVSCTTTTASLTTPAGWTLADGPLLAAAQTVWRLSKTLVAGDLGATVTLTLSGSRRVQAVMLVASGVNAAAVTASSAIETTWTTSPTLPTMTGVPSGALVLAVLARRRSDTPAAALDMPVSMTEVGAVASGFGSSPELSSLAGWLVTSSAGSVSGVGASSPSSSGVNYSIVLPATVAGGSGVTVTGATMTGTGSMPAGTVTASASAVSRPNVLTQLWRSGGHEITYTVAASSAGVPVQGAQALQPTGGQITDTNKPGVRRTLNLELAREIIGGQFLEDLLSPMGTTLTVTAHVTAGSVPVADIPWGCSTSIRSTWTRATGRSRSPRRTSGSGSCGPGSWCRSRRSRAIR